MVAGKGYYYPVDKRPYVVLYENGERFSRGLRFTHVFNERSVLNQLYHNNYHEGSPTGFIVDKEKQGWSFEEIAREIDRVYTDIETETFCGADNHNKFLWKYGLDLSIRPRLYRKGENFND